MRIHDFNPEMKLIAILRNPIDRAYSAYWYFVRNGFEKVSFESALEPCGGRFEVLHEALSMARILGDQEAVERLSKQIVHQFETSPRSVPLVAAERAILDAAFKDAKFEGPEATAFGQKIVVHGRPFYVKQDRIAATEKDVSLPRKKPHMVLVRFEHGAVGGGYAILGEACNYTTRGNEIPIAWTRKLTTKDAERAPVPLSYTYSRTVDKHEEMLKIEFDRVTVDSAHPVVLDPVARDLLKDAWERRFTLPTAMGIEGEFHRRPDRDLDKAGWSDVPGSFEVWGMKEIKVSIPENRVRNPGWRAGIEKTCTSNIAWIFGLLKATPFQEEFKDCGFELVPQGKEQVVQVYGYEKALAFKIDGGAIVGHYAQELGEKGWWDYRVKRTSDGQFMLDRMKREIGKRRIELRFRYGRVKGFQLPKKMDVLGVGVRGTYFGVAEYSFRRLKVLLPEKKG